MKLILDVSHKKIDNYLFIFGTIDQSP